MKLRYLRAVAVSGFAVIALTGASGSGCSGDSGEQGSGSEATPTADTSTSEDAAGDARKDVEISNCAYTEKRGITARLSATNGSATATFTYKVTVKFTAPDGTPLATQTPSLPYVRPGRTDSADVATPYTPKPGASTTGAKCEVTEAVRSIG
ncbi:hypothetical protein LE181_18645 [Streptomyces sp. SCA3-4]|uniref:hypothetical protein n=1 Tax=Streptomyces sichuanensis TaxID=2871810 RepID=UPI001CE3328F|nr:hypothetical protein [Streptomyces sichuanensis]MCA6094174.1 hypothetical protein [Streptomyces sichuanensis]